MKTINNSWRTAMLLLLCLFASQAIQAQLFETTFGQPNINEEVCDSKPLFNGNEYAVLSNFDIHSPNVSQILLTRLDVAGNVTSAFSLRDAANPNDAYVAKAMEVDLNAVGQPIGYFFTGYRLSGTGQQMFAIRTDLAGNPTWSFVLDNLIGAGPRRYTEAGVSIERQANGEIIVIGTSYDPLALVSRPVASRLNAATGAPIWAVPVFRYGSAAGQSFDAKESCNGVINGVAVVAITGKHSFNNVGHTFAFTINAATGAEVWANRFVYLSNGATDLGHCIVQNPLTQRFMVVGERFDNQGQSDLWVLNVNNNGTIWNSAVYDLGANIQVFAGRAVCLSLNGNSAVITGPLHRAAPPQTPLIRTFAMELGWGAAGAAAAPTWTTEYSNKGNPWMVSSPLGIESIDPVPGGTDPGYFIGSSLLGNNGTGDLSQLAIRVNNVGLHFKSECPVYSFQPAVVNQGNSFILAKNVLNGSWLPITVNKTDRTMPQSFCNELNIKGDEVIDRSNSDETAIVQAGTALVFPNPANGDATLRFDLGTEQAVRVTVTDLSGRTVWSLKETFGQGRQEINLPATQWLPGAYHVRIVSNEKQQLLKLNVIR